MTANLLKVALLTIMFFSCTPDPCGNLYLRKTNAYLDEVKTYIKTGDNNRDTDLIYTGRCAVYSDGNLVSIQQYKDGFDHGKWIFYFQNGNIETIGRFQDGKKVGKWKYYFENKSLRRISIYNNGEKDGLWFELNINGDTLWTEDFSNLKQGLN